MQQNRSRVFAVLSAIVVTSLAVACGSSSTDDASDAPVVLHGVFRPKAADSDAAIREIEFRDSHYRLQTKECVVLGCEEQGTFSLDHQNHLLALVVEGTGRAYSLPFDVRATRKETAGATSSASKTASFQAVLAPRADTPAAEKEDDGSLTNGGADLVNGGAELVNGAVSLIATEATLNGGDYTLDNEDTDQCDNSGAWPRVWEGQLCGGTAKTFGYAHCYVKTSGCGSSGRSCLDDDTGGKRWDARAEECHQRGGTGMESQGSGIYVAYACCKR